MLHPRGTFARTGLMLVLAGCTGSVGGEHDRDPGAGGQGLGAGGTSGGAPPSPRRLDRIPEAPLRCDDPSAALAADDAAFSRLTNAQYLRTLRDLAAPIALDPELGRDLPAETADKETGFLNNHAQQTVLSQSIEQLSLISLSASKAIVSGLDRVGIAACASTATAQAQADCAAAFIEHLGSRAYRRPLLADEQARLRELYATTRASLGSFTEALTVVGSAILASPQTIYMLEYGESDGRGLRRTGHEIATRLSYLIRGSAPDAAALEAAGRGALDTPEGVEAEALRLLGEPGGAAGLGEFASQWLRFGKIGADASAVAKSRSLFPEYTEAHGRASFAGLQRFVDETLLAPGGSLRELLTRNQAWVNAASAPLYGRSVPGEDLVPIDLDPAQRRGLLTQAALMAGFAHPTVHAPVQRGVFVLEHFLCSPPPPPPPNVPGAPPKEATDVETTRQKFVRQHEDQASCKGCHQRLDAVGFAFENYDTLGRWQTEERVGDRTLPIDASGELTDTYDADGHFENALELIDRLARSEQVAQCFANNLFVYAMTRSRQVTDGCTLGHLGDVAVESHGELARLLAAIVRSDAFRYLGPAEQTGGSR